MQQKYSYILIDGIPQFPLIEDEALMERVVLEMQALGWNAMPGLGKVHNDRQIPTRSLRRQQWLQAHLVSTGRL